MVIYALALLGLTLMCSCDVPGTTGRAVSESVRGGIDTFGQEDVLADVERIGTSPHVQRILQQLARDLIDTAAGAARGPEVEASLRALISMAIQQIRTELGDVPDALGVALDDLLLDAEHMVTRILRSALHDVRGMIDGDDVSAWARALLRDVLNDLIAIAEDALGEGSAEALGEWMRTMFRTVLADVDLEAGAQQIAHAAALGFGNGLAEALRGDLGEVIHQERDDLVHELREGSEDAARPWIVASMILLLAVVLVGVVLYRARREHRAMTDELERGAAEDRPAKEVVQRARARGVKVGSAPRPPTIEGPMGE
jgi:hypothetical protein